jgi:hypothetical protein
MMQGPECRRQICPKEVMIVTFCTLGLGQLLDPLDLQVVMNCTFIAGLFMLSGIIARILPLRSDRPWLDRLQ